MKYIEVLSRRQLFRMSIVTNLGTLLGVCRSDHDVRDINGYQSPGILTTRLMSLRIFVETDSAKLVANPGKVFDL